MTGLMKTAWQKRRLLLFALAAISAGFAGFRFAIKLDEGTKRHVIKQLREASRMPGRLLT